MKSGHSTMIMALALALANPLTSTGAQTTAAANKQTDPGATIRAEFDDVASRATANFHSSDSIEAHLASRGMTLHPRWVALRIRIQTELNQAQTAMREQDWKRAHQSIRRAGALVERFSHIMGGD